MSTADSTATAKVEGSCSPPGLSCGKPASGHRGWMQRKRSTPTCRMERKGWNRYELIAISIGYWRYVASVPALQANTISLWRAAGNYRLYWAYWAPACDGVLHLIWLHDFSYTSLTQVSHYNCLSFGHQYLAKSGMTKHYSLRAEMTKHYSLRAEMSAAAPG